MTAWLEPLLASRLPPLALHDRWHRECRMQRWVGQAMQADGMAALWLHPIACRATLARYLALPLLDREMHRVHFELMRRCDDWLWRQPFAHQRWAAPLTTAQWRPGGVVGGATTALEPAAQSWRRDGAAIEALLRARRDDGFAELVDGAALDALLNRLRRRLHGQDLANAFNLAGLRSALVGPRPLPAAICPPV
jgi:hypothetical protein